jgi:hypothetical protein|tara:strand:+ start:31 stop:189 length:159 start_codon:yes stop_codon:yes gene_type:complete
MRIGITLKKEKKKIRKDKEKKRGKKKRRTKKEKVSDRTGHGNEATISDTVDK